MEMKKAVLQCKTWMFVDRLGLWACLCMDWHNDNWVGSLRHKYVGGSTVECTFVAHTSTCSSHLDGGRVPDP